MKFVSLLVTILALAACSITNDEPQPSTEVPTENAVIITSTPTTTPTPTATPTEAPDSNSGTTRTVGQTAPPEIRDFSTSAVNVDADRLAARTERIPVGWSVANRPTNTNLVFEQFLDDGSVVNVELPRNNILVPSTGSGVVNPMPPGGDAQNIQLQIRLINLSTNVTLATAQLSLPIVAGSDIEIYATEACWDTPFPRTVEENRIPVGIRYRVVDGRTVSIFESETGLRTVGSLAADEAFTILEGPVCYTVDGDVGLRRWKISAIERDLVGWIQEYEPTQLNPIYNIERDTNVVSLDVQPRDVSGGDTIIITWNVENIAEVNIWEIIGTSVHDQMRVNDAGLAPSGSITHTVPHGPRSAVYSLSPNGTDGIAITINCAFTWWVNPRSLDDCPASAENAVQAAYQAFEKGFMLWQNDTIWVFWESNGSRGGRVFTDDWNGQTIETDDPPEGLLAPENGFGWLWSNNELVQRDLGWATAAEQGYSMTFQNSAPPSNHLGTAVRYYATLPTGSVLYFFTAIDAISWEPPS